MYLNVFPSTPLSSPANVLLFSCQNPSVFSSVSTVSPINILLSFCPCLSPCQCPFLSLSSSFSLRLSVLMLLFASPLLSTSFYIHVTVCLSSSNSPSLFLSMLFSLCQFSFLSGFPSFCGCSASLLVNVLLSLCP